MSSETTQRQIEAPPEFLLANKNFLIVIGAEGTTTLELPWNGSIVIGREATVEIRLTDSTTSRRHAEVVSREGKVSIRDLGSQNGTRVRGVQIQAECALTGVDLVEIGKTRFFLRTGGLPETHADSGHLLFERRLQDECLRARRDTQCVGLLMIEGEPPSSAFRGLIRSFLRPGDMVEEYGAGQYEVLVAAANVAGIEKVAVRLQQTLKDSKLTASVGLAVFPRDGTSSDELFTASRRALRNARRVNGMPTRPEVEGANSRLAIVRSPAMRAIYQMAGEVAAGNISVLITGETGSGKEMLAAAIHERSSRRAGPFVRVNCAALQAQLLEAELFGYVKGAFTGAFKDKVGLLEHATGGTLLLDEIGEMEGALQAKLLQVLEDKAVRRVGDLEPRPVDVRILAATNCDVLQMVQDGKFRADLYWRLCGISIALPPLRERPEEIVLLAQMFLEKYAAEMNRPVPELTPAVEKRLCCYSWPGNVRQLRNVMERVVLLSHARKIDLAHLPEAIATAAPQSVAPTLPNKVPDDGLLPPAAPGPVRDELEAVERERIIEALKSAGQNQTLAARRLGMPRRTFLTRLDRYGIERPRKKKTVEGAAEDDDEP